MAGKHEIDDTEIEKKVKNIKTKTSGKKKGLKIVGIIILVLVVLLLAVGIGAYWYISDKLGKMQQVDLNEDELNIDTQTDENLSKYRNIAIFAIDSRADEDYGKGNRSDGIIVASINNETKEVNLISVYRDTYVQIDGHGLDKITHAYSYGGPQLAINTLNTNLDLNIKEFIAVNFDAVAEAVNAIGGIELDISSAEMETMNKKYVRQTAEAIGQYSNYNYITKTGKQKVDGIQAVSYARVRSTAGGDYKRTERMREVIMKVAEKLKTRSVGEINHFLDVVLPKIYTNISSGDILGLVPDALSYKFNESIGWPYEVKGYTGAAWYGVPVTLESNVKKLHQDVFNEEEYEPTEYVKNVSNKISNQTGYR